MDQDYTNQEKIHQFLNGELDAQEIKAFKLELERNPELQEELAFSKDLLFTLKNKEAIALSTQIKSLASSNSIEPDFEALKELENIPSTKSTVGFNKWLLGGLLGVAMLFTGLFLFLPDAQKGNVQLATTAEQLAQKHVVPFGIQINVDQNGTTSFDKGIQAYEQKNYLTASQHLEQHLKKNYDSNAQFYLGLSYLLNNKTVDAIGALERTVDTATPPILEVAQWYLALAYIKNEQVPNAKNLLNNLTTNEEYGERATNLLNTL